MKLVIDSNRVMAGPIKDSATRMIILHEEFEFIAPEFLLTEIDKYKEYLMKKAHQTEKVFEITKSTLIEHIEFIPKDVIVEYIQEAEKIMKDIDIKDSPFLAVGMQSRTQGIWSEDKDFDQQSILKRYSTKDLFDFLLKK